MASHSDIRKSAKLMAQFLPGTDFICSGYSSVPKVDNMFGGGNFDSDDYDDYLILQRDFLTHGGLLPVREEEVVEVRRKAAKAMQALFKKLNFPPITDEEVETVPFVYGSQEMPERDRVEDLKASERILNENITGVEVARILYEEGFKEIAEKIFEIQKQRVVGDYLQTSAIFDSHFNVLSAINDPNDYRGPGTGYRLEGETKRKIMNLPQAKDPRETLMVSPTETLSMRVEEIGMAASGKDPNEVIIGLGPAFGTVLRETINGLPHREVLKEMIRGIEKEGCKVRVIKIYETSDCAFIGHKAAQLSGSGIAIGLQSKGTAVIHRKDLPPLDNLELLSQASNATLETYYTLGANAARYAKGIPVSPLPIVIDNTARLKYIVQTTLLHMKETEEVHPHRPPKELRIEF